jgi:hypothetical protein
VVMILKSKIHFLMPTFMDALRHGLKVAIDVEFIPPEWDSGRKVILEVLRTFYDLKEVTRWEEVPGVQFVPRAGSKFCLIMRFRNTTQAVYLKAMLYSAAQEHGWTFEDNL